MENRNRRTKNASLPRKKHKAIAVFLISLVIVIATATALRIFDERMQRKQEEAAAPKDPVSYSTATISAVGDIALDDAILNDALQSDGSYDFTSYFLNVAPLLFEADLTIGNLELTFSGEPYGGDAYSAPEELAQTLQTLGFDILQTANSKSIAGGISGLESTIDVLRSNNMEALGTYKTQYAHDNECVLIKEINGIRIAFVAYTKGFDGMSIPTGSEYCTNLLYEDFDSQYTVIDEEQILAPIKAAKEAEPDVIISMVHWGSVYKMDVSETQKEIADLMFESGVDVILGSHSHMVAPIEMREIELPDGATKQGFLAYSLGNFLSSDQEAYTQESLVLNLEFSKRSDTGETTITNVDYVPLYIVDNGKRAETRYEIHDVYQAIELYDTTYLNRVSDAVYEELKTAIETLKTNTGTTYDRGPIPPED